METRRITSKGRGLTPLAVAAMALLANPASAAVVVNEFAVPTVDGSPNGIASGSDGNLWFTEYGGGRIGRITTAGIVTEFTVPTEDAAPFGITTGPDGSLWFTESNGNKIGRITTSGVITEFTIPTATSCPHRITTGSDGNLWFTENSGNKIGRVVAATAPVNPGPAPRRSAGVPPGE